MTEHDQNIEDQTQDDQIPDLTKEGVHQTDVLDTEDQDTDLDQTDTEEQTEQEPDPRITSARKEAAKYRKRAQEAESDRDAAVDLAQNAVSAAIRSHLAAQGINSEILWIAGHKPVEFLDVHNDNGGCIDLARVDAAVTAFEERTGMVNLQRNRAGMIIGSPGMTGPPPSTGSWSDALRG